MPEVISGGLNRMVLEIYDGLRRIEKVAWDSDYLSLGLRGSQSHLYDGYFGLFSR